MANKHRDGGKEQYWRDVLRRQVTSRLPVAEFCRREGLRQPSFYAWRRTIAEHDRAGAKPGKQRREALSFVPVRVREEAPPRKAWLSLELGEGLVLRLPESIAAQRLAELVHALAVRREP